MHFSPRRAKANGGSEENYYPRPYPMRQSDPSGKSRFDQALQAIIVVLLSALVFFFQATYRKVEDLSSRVPAFEANQAALQREIANLSSEVRLLRLAREEQAKRGRR